MCTWYLGSCVSSGRYRTFIYLSLELQFKLMCWCLHCFPLAHAKEVKLRSSSYLLGLLTLAQRNHLSFEQIFLNALDRDIIFLCISMASGTIRRWGHFILTVIQSVKAIVGIPFCLLCEHWKDNHQHNIRYISEMECLYFMTCKIFGRVESWLVLPCLSTAWHLFPKWRCWSGSFKGETPTF